MTPWQARAVAEIEHLLAHVGLSDAQRNALAVLVTEAREEERRLRDPVERAEALAIRCGEMAAEVDPGHLDDCLDQRQRNMWMLLASARESLRSAEECMNDVAEMRRKP